MSASRRLGSQFIPLRSWSSHDRKASHNLAVAKRIERERFCPDWVIIVLFYSVIHKVNAFLVKNRNLGGSAMNHIDRANWVSTDSDLQPISVQYEYLEGEAKSIRYDPIYSFDKSFLQQANNFLTFIFNHINSLI